MELEDLVRRAAQRDVGAFVELTRRFQQFAFGSALAMVGDFHRAEDIVREAFVAAWASLPTLAEPADFPAWLRSIVRHHASQQLRRGYLETTPLAAAAELPADEPAADDRLDRRNQARLALVAIAGLPATLREAAALFYVHDCSHQDIAAFLGLSVTTVNNRLHAARAKLKERMIAMVSDTLHAHSLPDDFAHRIGRPSEGSGWRISWRSRFSAPSPGRTSRARMSASKKPSPTVPPSSTGGTTICRPTPSTLAAPWPN